MLTSSKYFMSAAVISLGLNAMATHASSETKITQDVKTPLSTSSSGDLVLDKKATQTLKSGTGISVDSDHKLTVDGKIDMSASADNSTGILLSGNRKSELTFSGEIVVTDDYTAKDTLNNDKIPDGPFAQGVGRYGIRSTGPGAFNGNITLKAGSKIQVEGNESFGVSLENLLNGKFFSKASISILGDQTVGIWIKEGATGDVYLSGSVNAQGKDTRAVVLNGIYSGRVNIDGVYTSTGYATLAPYGLTADQLKALMNTPSNMYQSGATVTLAGTFEQGARFSGRVNKKDEKNTDEDGNGVPDADQQDSSITSYGTAPALLVGSDATDTILKPLVYTSTGTQAPSTRYGLLLQGTIAAYGVFPGFSATGLKIGGFSRDVSIINGLGLTGSITATAVAGDARAVLIGGRANVPTIDIEGGSILATVSSVTTPTKNGDKTTYTTVGQGAHAIGIDIAPGANVSSINITKSSGGIQATATGSTTQATAILDRSGTLSRIVNSNTIIARINATDDDGDGKPDELKNRPIAIDARANTKGIEIVQTDLAPKDDKVPPPLISGDILLGSGDDRVTIDGGIVNGNIDFGGGTNQFSIKSGTYLGKMSGTGTLTMDLAGGTTALLAGSQINATTLKVGGAATLGLVLATDTPNVPIIKATGSAVFENGATLKVSLDKLILTPQTYTLMTASSISLGNIGTSLEGKSPYIYSTTLSLDSANKVLTASFRLKTQAEGRFTSNQYATFLPVLEAVKKDTNATALIMSATDKETFDQFFNQFLPDYSGENILTLSQGADTVTRQIGAIDRLPEADSQYWLQERGLKIRRDRGETSGFDATSIVLSGGREVRLGGRQAVGTYIEYTAAAPRDSFAIRGEQIGNSDIIVGGYWRMVANELKLWSNLGMGYVRMQSERELLTPQVARTARGKWNGYSYSAGAGVAYKYDLGALSLTPQAFVSTYALKEDAHHEVGGGDFFNLFIEERKSKLTSGTALVILSYEMGLIQPEVWIGYKQNFSAEIADTVAKFKDGSPFVLKGGDVAKGGPVAGFSIGSSNELGGLAIEASFEDLDAYKTYSLTLRTRFRF